MKTTHEHGVPSPSSASRPHLRWSVLLWSACDPLHLLTLELMHGACEKPHKAGPTFERGEAIDANYHVDA
jgi:hypothetical protein